VVDCHEPGHTKGDSNYRKQGAERAALNVSERFEQENDHAVGPSPCEIDINAEPLYQRYSRGPNAEAMSVMCIRYECVNVHCKEVVGVRSEPSTDTAAIWSMNLRTPRPRISQQSALHLSTTFVVCNTSRIIRANTSLTGRFHRAVFGA
jgi:hypothetical protein